MYVKSTVSFSQLMDTVLFVSLSGHRQERGLSAIIDRHLNDRKRAKRSRGEDEACYDTGYI